MIGHKENIGVRYLLRIKLLPTFSYYFNSCFIAFGQVFSKWVTFVY